MRVRAILGSLLSAVVVMAIVSPAAGARSTQLTWQFAKSSPFAGTRFDGQFVSAQNRVYFLGFRTVGDATDGSVWYFNRATGQYVDTGVDMKVPVSNYGIAALQDQNGLGLFIFGGRNANGQIINVTQVYRPGTNTTAVVQTDSYPGRTPAGCTSLPAMGVAVMNNLAVVMGGMSFASAGCIDDQSSETWVYNPMAPAGSRWSAGPNLNVARGYITPAVLGGRFYAIGGDTISAGSLFATSTVEAWKPGAPSWNDAGVADLPQPCDESQAFGISQGAKIVLAGCGQWSLATPDVFEYTAATNTWANVGTLNETRRNHAGALISSGATQTMFVLGGYNEASGFLDPTVTSEVSNPNPIGGPAAPRGASHPTASAGVTTN
jgi:Galactose oxidase, central domain